MCIYVISQNGFYEKFYILGNLLCLFVFNHKSVDLKPSFSNILKCLSIYDMALLVSKEMISWLDNLVFIFKLQEVKQWKFTTFATKKFLFQFYDSLHILINFLQDFSSSCHWIQLFVLNWPSWLTGVCDIVWGCVFLVSFISLLCLIIAICDVFAEYQTCQSSVSLSTKLEYLTPELWLPVWEYFLFSSQQKSSIWLDH